MYDMAKAKTNLGTNSSKSGAPRTRKMMVSSKMCIRDSKMVELKPFSKWRLSWHYGWGYVAGLILASIGQVAAVTLVSNIGTNVMSVFGMVFLVQGAAVAWYFFDKYKLLPVAKWLIMIFIVLNPTLLQILSWAGVLDAWLDFRRLSS